MKQQKVKIKRLPILLIYCMILGGLMLAVLIFSLAYSGGGADLLLSVQDHEEADPAVAMVTPPPPAPSPSSPISVEGRLIPYLDGALWGYKNTKGKVAVEPAFSAAHEFSGSIAFAAKNGLYGIINRKGVFTAEPQWADIRPFSEGLAAVKRDSLWGYINENGQLVIDYAYREAGSFYCGRAYVRVGSAYGYIDPQGTLAIGEKWRVPGDFSDDVAFAVSDEYEKDRQYIINRLGVKVATLPSSARGTAFCEGFAMIRDGNKAYFINRSGSSAFRTVYEDALSFSGGFAAVRQGGKWGYINTRGVLVIEPQFDAATAFSNGLAAVRDASNGLFGYIGTNGDFVIAAQYDEAEPFIDGCAVVKTGNAYSLIDKEAKSVFLYEVLN